MRVSKECQNIFDSVIAAACLCKSRPGPNIALCHTGADYRKQVAAIYLLGFFIDLVNMFITGVATPDIGRGLQAPVAQLGCISSAHIIGPTIVMPFSARFAAYYGSKTVFIASLLTFLCTSIGAGQTDSIGTLPDFLPEPAAGGRGAAAGRVLAAS